MKAHDEGTHAPRTELDSVRDWGDRALRDLHQAMLEDLQEAEARAERAERKLANARRRVHRERRRAERAEDHIRATQPNLDATRSRTAGQVRRAFRGIAARVRTLDAEG
jgi:predicted  nucleic acid-binding Zn-ribbon protein